MNVDPYAGMGPVQGDVRPPAPPLPEDWQERARRVIARYPSGQERSALLPLLYLAQAEHGYVSNEAMGEIAELLGMTRAEVAGVATFYTMFKRSPQGQWLVSVCTQPSCTLNGAADIVRALEEELGSFGTTVDEVTTEAVECLCACDGAPVVSVNYENYYGKSAEEIVEIVRALRAGGTPPASSQGDVPAFLEVNRRLAGVDAPAPVLREGEA